MFNFIYLILDPDIHVTGQKLLTTAETIRKDRPNFQDIANSKEYKRKNNSGLDSEFTMSLDDSDEWDIMIRKNLLDESYSISFYGNRKYFGFVLVCPDKPNDHWFVLANTSLSGFAPTRSAKALRALMCSTLRRAGYPIIKSLNR